MNCSIASWVCSFNKYLLSTYHRSRILPSTGTKTMNKNTQVWSLVMKQGKNHFLNDSHNYLLTSVMNVLRKVKSAVK
jgi:hypothetical protein